MPIYKGGVKEPTYLELVELLYVVEEINFHHGRDAVAVALGRFYAEHQITFSELLTKHGGTP